MTSRVGGENCQQIDEKTDQTPFKDTIANKEYICTPREGGVDCSPKEDPTNGEIKKEDKDLRVKCDKKLNPTKCKKLPKKISAIETEDVTIFGSEKQFPNARIGNKYIKEASAFDKVKKGDEGFLFASFKISIDPQTKEPKFIPIGNGIEMKQSDYNLKGGQILESANG